MEIPLPAMPTEGEARKKAQKQYDAVARFNIDQWPDEIHALSMPTKLVEVDANVFVKIYDADMGVMDEYASRLDGEMGWDRYMIRLNSRSPKDASSPVAPITCSGKQAMAWLATSMRCLDDAVTAAIAERPLFIALREARPIKPEWELRCFAKEGALLGVSRYDYGNPPAEGFPDLPALKIAQDFYGAHLRDLYKTVVFDLALGCGSDPLLIELNPYGLSDPCCFGSYEAIENTGGFVWKTQS